MNRAQASLVTVLVAPVGPGEDYVVDLLINEKDGPRSFTFTSLGGETINDVAAGLELVLLAEQTKYSVAVDVGVPWRLMVVGPLGEAFAVGVTANLQHDLTEEAFLSSRLPDLSTPTSEPLPVGDLRVIVAESVVGFGLREFATRRVPEGDVDEVNLLRVRELGTSNTFDVDSREILTVIERAP